VALTFDDGYRDHASVAGPLLRSQRLPATFFLVRDFLSGDLGGWWEEVGWAFAHATAADLRWDGRRYATSSPRTRRAAARAVADALKTLDSERRQEAITELRGRLAPVGPPLERQFLNWDEAENLLRQGHDIGSHTCRHPILSREGPTAQHGELVDSRRDLEAHFRRPVHLLAYPNGRAEDYSEETLRLTRDAGYAFAVTTRPRLAGPETPPDEVPRLVLTAETDVRQVLSKAGRVLRRTSSSVLHVRPGQRPFRHAGTALGVADPPRAVGDRAGGRADG
jgi:peptidoglycan/xylan/chitin deacetylase (PgdA/CDA1 family)